MSVAKPNCDQQVELMIFYLCCFLFVQSTVEAKQVEIFGEQFRVIGDSVYCVDTGPDKDTRIVSCYQINEGEFKKRFEFEYSHPRLVNVYETPDKIYCLSEDGVIEKRDLKEPNKIGSEFKLIPPDGSNLEATFMFPELSIEGKDIEVSGFLVHSYTRPKYEIYQRVARVSVSPDKFKLEWDAQFDSSHRIEFLNDGFYVVGENVIAKHDLVSGKPVSQINSTAARFLHFIGEDTILIRNDVTFEFWDREKFELKRRIIVPDARMILGDVIVVRKEDQFTFYDLSGELIDKYPAINFIDPGRIWWIQDDKICYRKVDGTIQIFNLLNKSLVFEASDVKNFHAIGNGQYLVSKETAEPERRVLRIAAAKK